MALTAQVLPSSATSHSIISRFNELSESDKHVEALELIEKYVTTNPEDAQALTALASGLKKLGRHASAYCVAKQSVALRPDRPETWGAVGHTAQQLWRQDEALSAYKKALQRAKSDKQRALYLNNTASVHLDFGNFAKAEQPLRDALKIDDNDKMARHNLGLSLMAQHQWREGWHYYAASIGSKARLNVKYKPAPGEPIWDGTKGQRVVVYGEQGLGDEICAASMLPNVIRDSERVVIDCDHRLVGLFKRSFPQAIVYGTRWKKEIAWKPEHREIDASVSAFEVGKFYRNDDAEFPGTPYLVPDPDRVLMWKALWASKRKPTIGIAWSGGTWQNASAFRQLPLKEWQPIFDAVDANWVSLQYKDASSDISGTPVVQYPSGTLTPDYDDTAALVASCDLVIGMQTSVFHLAGALGKEAWVMIPKTSQWRYGESGDRIPWYGSMKLYRQADTWQPTVKQIAEDLRARFSR